MFPENLYTTSGLSILLHGVISLPDAMPYDKSMKWIIMHSNAHAIIKQFTIG